MEEYKKTVPTVKKKKGKPQMDDKRNKSVKDRWEAKVKDFESES